MTNSNSNSSDSGNNSGLASDNKRKTVNQETEVLLSNSAVAEVPPADDRFVSPASSSDRKRTKKEEVIVNTHVVVHTNAKGAELQNELNLGDSVSDGHGRSVNGRYSSIKESYAKAEKAGSKEEALKIMREEQPEHFVLQYHKLEPHFDRVFKPPSIPWVSEYPSDSFTNVPEELQRWKDSLFNRNSVSPKSIIIEGPSRIGKTQWAKSLGRHNYLCGHIDLNPAIFSNDAEYNIIDNVDPKGLKHWEELIGAQRDWQTGYKYGRRVQIKGGIPAIVLCNRGPGSSFSEYLDEPRNAERKSWTLQHATFVFVKEPLFST